jgi:hypothetical protein
MNLKSRWRDVLVMLVFALVAFGLAFASYARIRTGQDWRAIQNTPVRP